MPEIDSLTSPRVQKLVALVFVSCIVVLFLTGFDTIKAKIRDIKRRADMRLLVKALDLYYDKYGKYLDSADDWQGWDLSIGYSGGRPSFLSNLRDEGFIDREAVDPINDPVYHYRYQKYQAGDYGCATAFYILQAVNFELSAKDNGWGQCPELNWVESVPNGYTTQNID